MLRSALSHLAALGPLVGLASFSTAACVVEREDRPEVTGEVEQAAAEGDPELDPICIEPIVYGEVIETSAWLGGYRDSDGNNPAVAGCLTEYKQFFPNCATPWDIFGDFCCTDTTLVEIYATDPVTGACGAGTCCFWAGKQPTDCDQWCKQQDPTYTGRCVYEAERCPPPPSGRIVSKKAKCECT